MQPLRWPLYFLINHTPCFTDKLDSVVEHAWSEVETAPPCVRGDWEDGDLLLAAMIEVAYQGFWLAPIETTGMGSFYVVPIR